MSNITWGVTPAPDGSPLRTVFCLDCREVFGRYLTGIDHMDVVDQAQATHICPGCNRKLPLHLNMHVGELEMFSCTRPILELEPMTTDTWYRPEKKIKADVPFTCAGGSVGAGQRTSNKRRLT